MAVQWGLNTLGPGQSASWFFGRSETGMSEALCKRFPFGVVFSLFCFFSALKKQNGRRTGWRTAPLQLSIQWAFANARVHF